jgi:putative transposase
MPWKVELPMDQKTQFVSEYCRESMSFSELCRRYEISRKTGYKWIARFEAEGAGGLVDRSRRPHLSPKQTIKPLRLAIIEARQRHPTWGAKKLLRILQTKDPQANWPSRWTISQILRREGLIKETVQRRRKKGHPGKPILAAAAPNELWCVDFKGQFKTLDGRYCYPLTVTDYHSRYLIGCRALLSTGMKGAIQVFKELFSKYGLPEAILSDNGTPFASTAIGRLSLLSVWWIQLGIRRRLIEPGKPEQNGRHERMHRTLKAETTRPPGADLLEQQKMFDNFQDEYNFVRPHEGIAMRTPAEIYLPSIRTIPRSLPKLVYPAHFETRLVSSCSSISWKGRAVPVSQTCVGLSVGLEEVDHKLWDVYLGPIKLGRLFEESFRIEDHQGRLKRIQNKNV